MVVEPADLRPLGQTGLQVSPVCIGTSPLASMPVLYGYEVPEDRAEATIRAALRSPFNFMDTSNNYGGGSAERCIGRVLAAAGGLPPGYVLATKVDADPVTGDFSGDRVKRSLRALLRQTADHAADFYEALGERRTCVTAGVRELREVLGRPLPDEPVDASRVIAELVRDVEAGCPRSLEMTM